MLNLQHEAKIVTTKILDGKNIAGILSKEVDLTEYIEIPNEINGKPVVRAMVDPEFSEYSFKNNRVLKKIIINGNVTEIDEGMFMNMQELERIELRSNDDSPELYIKNYAFANCLRLGDRISTRSINEECNEALIYWGS